MLLLLLGAALGGSQASGGPLLACGTHSTDTDNIRQILSLFTFVRGVCVELGETLDPLHSQILPSTCATCASGRRWRYRDGFVRCVLPAGLRGLGVQAAAGPASEAVPGSKVGGILPR